MTRVLKEANVSTPNGRRFWNGKAWSVMVRLGESDEDTLASQSTWSPIPVIYIEWCGLTQPHVDPLPYPTSVSAKTKLANTLVNMMTRRVRLNK